jgi:DNA-nicking Smr family endonuclease
VSRLSAGSELVKKLLHSLAIIGISNTPEVCDEHRKLARARSAMSTDRNSHPRTHRSSRQVTVEERELFRQALGGVRPLQTDTVSLRGPGPTPRVRAASDHSPITDDLAALRDPSSAELVYADELCFKRVGVPPTILRKLRRGQFPRQAALDLHGQTTAEAKTQLVEFLQACRARGLRCVRIVHGKGYRSPEQQPVLKPKLAHWLGQRDDVVAYVSAQPAEGGTGALYVLLKIASNRGVAVDF